MCLGIRRSNAGPWLLLPRARPFAFTETAWACIFPEQAKLADLPCNSLQLSERINTLAMTTSNNHS
jgi:hypothetical protein